MCVAVFFGFFHPWYLDAERFATVAAALGQDCSPRNRYAAIDQRDFTCRANAVFAPGATLVDGENHCLAGIHLARHGCATVWPQQARTCVCLVVRSGNIFVHHVSGYQQVGSGILRIFLSSASILRRYLEESMSETTKNNAPAWFTIVAVVLLIWNLLGVMAYIMQVTMSPEALAALPDAQRQLYETTPEWATAAFAIAVNGGTLGCLLLLLKRNLAGIFLQLSLAGVLVQMFHSFFMSKSFEVFGPGGMVMPIMVLLIAIYLVMLAGKAKTKRWTS